MRSTQIPVLFLNARSYNWGGGNRCTGRISDSSRLSCSWQREMRGTPIALLLVALVGVSNAWQAGVRPFMRTTNAPLPVIAQEASGGESSGPDGASAPDARVCDFPGCDGNGRAIGGLGAIPLFEWWPIKAYRPCPKCAEAGRRYSRSGQTLDEVCGLATSASPRYRLTRRCAQLRPIRTDRFQEEPERRILWRRLSHAACTPRRYTSSEPTAKSASIYMG